jgi:hypothetical protein
MSDTFYNDKLYIELNEKIRNIMLSCKTLEHWYGAIKYINLVEDKLVKHFSLKYYGSFIMAFTSHRRGFCHGMMQALREQHNILEEERLP